MCEREHVCVPGVLVCGHVPSCVVPPQGLLVLSLATGEPLTLQPARLPSDLPDLLRNFISK